MLKALEQVHGEGVIHRDVKPANYCMAPPDAASPTSGAPRLLGHAAARRWGWGWLGWMLHAAAGQLYTPSSSTFTHCDSTMQPMRRIHPLQPPGR